MSETNKKKGFQLKGKEPLNIDVKVRITESTNKKLLEYAEKNNLKRADVIRKSIDEMLK